ncbi:hypothetical protein Tco_0427368 [Tanacetum coccineum]
MEEDKAGPDPVISRMALAGPDFEPTHDEFMVDFYPKVQESLKFPADEHVILEDPLSSTGTLSSMKNLEDAYAIGINSLMTNPLMMNWENSMWKLKWSPWSLFQYIKRLPLFLHFTALEKKLFDLEQTNKNLDNTTQNLRSRVYTLELRDLPYKINEEFRENVKEAVQIALQAPLRDRFRDLSGEDMKEMLRQRMFEIGSFKSLPEHITLYKALEESMECAQRDEFLAEKDKSRKRRRDDQGPPPPPPDSDQILNEEFRENVKEAVQIALQAPLRDRFRDLSGEDMKEMLRQRMFETGSFKSLPEHITLYKALEESMECAQRDGFLAEKDKSRKRRRDDQGPPPPPPDSDQSKRRQHDAGTSGSSQPQAPRSSAWKNSNTQDGPSSNNPANALATTYQAPAENSLLEKIGDMRMFMNWYCQNMEKTKLTQADLEDQIDWANPEGDQVRIDISKPLPLSGPPGHVTIQT